MGEIKLLDCTLRDGGYVNDWEFGNNKIINIFERLVSGNIDIIEVGFLDERRLFDENRSIMPDSKSVDRIYGALDKGASLIVGMIDYGTCSIDRIDSADECFLDGIRVIFKKQKMHEAIDFCKKIKEKGYKVFAQAVSITSYDDCEYDQLIELVNGIEPYAFSLVDTYGLLHKQKLLHYYQRADERLKESIAIGYHAHNNFQLAYANCIELLENPPQNRTLLVDGTLYGMGKSAGNAPIELLVTYMNEHGTKHYSVSQLLEAIDVTIMDIYRQIPWGYNFKFFISAAHDCHPNYVSYLMDKQKLSVKSINEILDRLQGEKKLLYDQEYVEHLYVEYQTEIAGDESGTVFELVEELKYRDILLLGPGNTIESQKGKVDSYMANTKPITISVNFIPNDYEVDYVFISNSKRYVQLSNVFAGNKDVKTIATSNITKATGEFDYVLNYAKLLDEEAMIVDNPMVMMLRFLAEHTLSKHVALAGFDGYTSSQTSDYVNPNMAHSFSKSKALDLNKDVEKSIARIKDCPQLLFVTDTMYRL